MAEFNYTIYNDIILMAYFNDIRVDLLSLSPNKRKESRQEILITSLLKKITK